MKQRIEQFLETQFRTKEISNPHLEKAFLSLVIITINSVRSSNGMKHAIEELKKTAERHDGIALILTDRLLKFTNEFDPSIEVMNAIFEMLKDDLQDIQSKPKPPIFIKLQISRN